MSVEFAVEVIIKGTGKFGLFLRVNDILVLVIYLTIYDVKADVRIKFNCKEPVLDILEIFV